MTTKTITIFSSNNGDGDDDGDEMVNRNELLTCTEMGAGLCVGLVGRRQWAQVGGEQEVNKFSIFSTSSAAPPTHCYNGTFATIPLKTKLLSF